MVGWFYINGHMFDHRKKETKQNMEDREKMIEQIIALLQKAPAKVLTFIYWYLIG